MHIAPHLRLLGTQVDAAELGHRIRDLRLQLGLTQREVIGPVATTAYLSRIESGARRPSAETLAHIAQALGTDVASLLAGLASTETPASSLPVDVVPARRAARATAEWLGSKHDSAAYGRMVKAVQMWESVVEAASDLDG